MSSKFGKGTNFSAADFGRLTDIKDYVLQLGPEIKISGKVFGGQAVGATGGDVLLLIRESGAKVN